MTCSGKKYPVQSSPRTGFPQSWAGFSQSTDWTSHALKNNFQSSPVRDWFFPVRGLEIISPRKNSQSSPVRDWFFPVRGLVCSSPRTGFFQSAFPAGLEKASPPPPVFTRSTKIQGYFQIRKRFPREARENSGVKSLSKFGDFGNPRLEITLFKSNSWRENRISGPVTGGLFLIQMISGARRAGEIPTSNPE